MRYFYFVFSLLIGISTSAQSISETEKFTEIGLVWGLMKYHHPEVSKGAYDWNAVFIDWCEKAETISDKQDLDSFLLSAIKTYDSKKTVYNEVSQPNANKKVFLKNYDYNWIKSMNFDTELTSFLEKLEHNNNIGDYYASVGSSNQLSFKNEKKLPGFDVKFKSHRLLVLFSYWNVIQYWYVNKFLTAEKWSNVPYQLTETFIKADTDYKMELAKSNLFNKLGDSHSIRFPAIFESLKFPNFRTKIVNDTLEVVRIVNQEQATNEKINLGDKIVSIQSKSVKEYLAETIAPLFPAQGSYYHNMVEDYFALSSTSDSLVIGVISKDKMIETVIRLSKESKPDNPSKLEKSVDTRPFYFLQPDIGYINLLEISKKDLAKAFEDMKTTKGIVIDLRNYPKFISDQDLARFLYPERKTFLEPLFPLPKTPSVGHYETKSMVSKIIDPFKAGKVNKDFYKGKIILFVNRRTISKAEFIGMAIQQAPNCITIGKRTAGAVMNVVSYVFPDGIETIFTGSCAFYPDGMAVQKNGLKIDEYVGDNYFMEDDSYIKAALNRLRL